MNQSNTPPWWFLVILLIAIAPIGSAPAMISEAPAGDVAMKTYAYFYPLVIAASAFYAWTQYYTRTLLAWIMAIFMYLVDASMLYLFFFTEHPAVAAAL